MAHTPKLIRSFGRRVAMALGWTKKILNHGKSRVARNMWAKRDHYSPWL